MKKFILVVLAFVFVTGSWGITYGPAYAANSASSFAPVSGCMPGDTYSRTTGIRCVTSPARKECTSGDLFNSVTGKPCEPLHPTPPLPCEITILPIWSRGDQVRMLQQQLKDEGFLSASGKVDGIYGPMTSAAVTQYYKARPCPAPASSSVVVSGVRGPQALDVGQEGTWTVTAYNKEAGDLAYSVVWGDEKNVLTAAGMMERDDLKTQQSATFTHAYSQAGVYTPTFIVTSENTIRCIQAPCPSNGGRAKASLSVKVGNIQS